MKKLLSLLLVAAMVLGLFGTIGTAFAAPVFPDIAGNVAEKDIVKLSTLGILGGYPDGTFKPEGNITRAEFAKIAVLALNKGGSANLLKNTASQFKDVPAGQWYTGFVNVAVANGIIKGYDDGTFKPNNNITEAEAVTMLLRDLGYNDNLVGTWPLNYIMKAADLGVIGDTFASDAKATRAFVATTAVSTLNQGTVTYNSETKVFSNPTGTLLAGIGTATIIPDATVSAYSSTNGTLAFGGAPIKIAAGAKVATGEAYADLVNKHVNYMTKVTAGVTEIVYVETLTSVVAGKVASVDAVANSITLTNGTVVKLTATPTIEKNGAPANILDLVDADVTALMDSDAKAYRVTAYKLDTTGALTAKSTTVTNGVATNAITLVGTYTITANTIIVRNGAVATFADLKVNDDVKLSKDASNNAIYVDAYAVVKTGTVASYTVTQNGHIATITFTDGTTVTAVTDTLHAADFTVGAELGIGVKADFTINRDGKASAVANVTLVTASAAGKVTALSTTVTSTGTAYTITLDNGTTYTEATGATYTVNTVGSTFAGIAKDDNVKLSLNSAGKYSAVVAYKNVSVLDDAALIGTFAGAWATYSDTATVLTLNGVTKTALADIRAAGANTIRVVWNGTTGKLARLDSVNLAVSGTVSGTIVATVGATTTYTVNYFDATGAAQTVVFTTNFKVMKDGVLSNFDGIAIGQKIAADLAVDATYAEVTADTTKATITHVGTANVFTFDEPIKSIVWSVNGVPAAAAEVTAHFTAGAVGFTVPDLAAATTYVVGIQVTDFAGNVTTWSGTVVMP